MKNIVNFLDLTLWKNLLITLFMIWLRKVSIVAKQQKKNLKNIFYYCKRICNKLYENNRVKLKYHFPITGKYRGSAHSKI